MKCIGISLEGLGYARRKSFQILRLGTRRNKSKRKNKLKKSTIRKSNPKRSRERRKGMKKR
jgi:hypothetical protein